MRFAAFVGLFIEFKLPGERDGTDEGQMNYVNITYFLPNYIVFQTTWLLLM